MLLGLWLPLLLMVPPESQCRYFAYEKDTISLGGGTNAGLVTRFVARPRVTKERQDFEQEVEGLVASLADHVLHELRGNRTSVRWQMLEGEPDQDLTHFFKQQDVSEGIRRRQEEEQRKREEEWRKKLQQMSQVGSAVRPFLVYIPTNRPIRTTSKPAASATTRPTRPPATLGTLPTRKTTVNFLSSGSALTTSFSWLKPRPGNRKSTHTPGSLKIATRRPGRASTFSPGIPDEGFRHSQLPALPNEASVSQLLGVLDYPSQQVIPSKRPAEASAIKDNKLANFYKPTSVPWFAGASQSQLPRPTIPATTSPTTTTRQTTLGTHAPTHLHGPFTSAVDSGVKYKPTARPVTLNVTAGDFLAVSTTREPDRQTSTTTTTTTALPALEGSQDTTETTTSRPSSGVVHMPLSEFLSEVARAVGDFISRLSFVQFGKALEEAAGAFSRVFSDLARGEDSLPVAVAAVFGIPSVAAALSVLGAAPGIIALAAWTIPAAALIAQTNGDN